MSIGCSHPKRFVATSSGIDTAVAEKGLDVPSASVASGITDRLVVVDRGIKGAHVISTCLQKRARCEHEGAP